ncbi:SPOR domain-containing protein [Porticoccus sp.]|uniref:SPOR domain-containing protein n=1 Tax=Porticoccus sp. TaxID=2024853 RepID=UPI003F698ED9
MERRVFGLIIVGALIVGCAGSDTNEDRDNYIGWVCSGARQSDDWSCQMREIRNGRVVATSTVAVVGDATVVDGQDVSPSSERDRPRNLQVVSPPSQRWRNQLPGLDSTPVISESQSFTLAERKLRERPPRVPELVPSVVARKTSPSPASAPQSSVAEPVAYALGDNIGGDLSIDAKKPAYTLQLGAFKDPAQIRLFVERHRLGDLGVQQFQSYSEKQHWQLLVWGTFESPAKAREAWRAIARQYPGVEPWVRSMSSLDMESSQAVAVDG